MIVLISALFAVVVVLSVGFDCVRCLMLYIVKARSFYRQKKYLSVGSPQSDYVFIDEKDTDKVIECYWGGGGGGGGGGGEELYC